MQSSLHPGSHAHMIKENYFILVNTKMLGGFGYFNFFQIIFLSFVMIEDSISNKPEMDQASQLVVPLWPLLYF